MQTAAPKRILIIDDDPAILKGLEMLLTAAGYQVESSTHGEETYARIDSFKPDLVILDVMLIGLDGRDICRNIKNNKKTQDLPVMMISANSFAEEEMKGHGATTFISKPFDMTNLLGQVAHCLKTVS